MMNYKLNVVLGISRSYLFTRAWSSVDPRTANWPIRSINAGVLAGGVRNRLTVRAASSHLTRGPACTIRGPGGSGNVGSRKSVLSEPRRSIHDDDACHGRFRWRSLNDAGMIQYKKQRLKLIKKFVMLLFFAGAVPRHIGESAAKNNVLPHRWRWNRFIL